MNTRLYTYTVRIPPLSDFVKRANRIVEGEQDRSPRRLLSTSQAAKYLSISVWTLRRLAYAGEIPSIRGRSWRFDLKDLERWIEAKKERG